MLRWLYSFFVVTKPVRAECDCGHSVEFVVECLPGESVHDAIQRQVQADFERQC